MTNAERGERKQRHDAGETAVALTRPGHTSLMRTRVRRPQPGRSILPRPRLFEALNSARTLTVVIAPAGYGKTTLLTAWLDSVDEPSAWLTLDCYANDVALFITYVVEALRTQFPGAAEHTIQAVTGTNIPSVEVLSRLLVSDLAAIEHPFTLVLDDFHTIREAAIHHLIGDVVRESPENLRLVISSRHDPPLPLARHRASGELMEVRAADLRFTATEAERYLRECMVLDLDASAAAQLTAQTEGWPAGLYLAGLYVRHSGSTHGGSADVNGENRYVMDYLVNEVLAQLPVSVQEFLIKTSILEELCQPLCEAVLGGPALTSDGQPILEWLEQNGIFVLPADEQGHWYRCHYLFKRMLRMRLERETPPNEVAALQYRASAWLEENGHLDEALRHALQSNITEAVRFFAEHRHELLNRSERYRLERWLQMFPDSVIQAHPDLLLALVHLKVLRQQILEASRLLDQVEALLAQSQTERTSHLLGELAARRSAVEFWKGDLARAHEAGERALRYLPAEWWYVRGTTRVYLSVTLKCLSESERANEVLNVLTERNPPPNYVTLMTGAAVFVRYAEADLLNVASAAGYLANRADRFPESELVSTCRYFMGFYHYQRDELAEAEPYLSGAVTFPYASHAVVVVNSAVLLARIRALQGRPEEAKQIVSTVMDFAYDMHSDLLLAAAHAVRADLALRLGHLAEAGQWAAQISGFYPVPYAYPFIPAVEAATILLEMNTPSARQQARGLLNAMMEYFTRTGYTSVRLQVLALQALLAWQEGDERSALPLLEESVRMAETGRFLRLYPDLGTGLKPLLQRLYQQGVSPTYVSEILTVFGEPARSHADSWSPVAVAPRVLLTYREQEVLQLLVERRSDKQIAEVLVVSIETVRSHIYHLATKLGVHGRRAIAQAAQDLNLLD